MTSPRSSPMIAALVLVLALGPALGAPGHAAAAERPGFRSAPDSAEEDTGWRWPVDGPRTVSAPYRAPAHAYGAGHRGIDIATAIGQDVFAPAGGVVAFRGTVVDRPLLTIDHGDGYVSTYEPLDSALEPGDTVAAGDIVGTVAQGGHSPSGTVHIGVRLDGVYIDPLLLFGAPARAILLPCCDGP